MARKSSFCIYTHVTETLLAALEAGPLPWRKPWDGHALSIPLRATGEPYQGTNVLLLWVEAHLQGYTDPHWMTYRQAQALGGQVRKGACCTRVIKFGTFTPKDEDRPAEAEAERAQGRKYLRSYPVFNVAQIEGLHASFYEGVPPKCVYQTDPDAQICDWFARMGVPITHGTGDRAYYQPATDSIHLPDTHLFKRAEGYLATLAHEMSHATGAKHRCDRVSQYASMKKQMAYAQEEVVAELSAVMVCARLGISPDFGNSAAYVQSWMRCLKADNRAILRLAAQAQASANWMFEQAPAPVPT